MAINIKVGPKELLKRNHTLQIWYASLFIYLVYMHKLAAYLNQGPIHDSNLGHSNLRK